MSYEPIPVSEANWIAGAYQKNQVVILSYDALHKKTHTTTYGVTAWDKENAAATGRLCAEAIGCDLSKSVQIKQIEVLVKRCGWRLRHG